MESITSKDNPRLKLIRKLLTQRKIREQKRQCVVEQRHLIEELLSSRSELVQYLVKSDSVLLDSKTQFNGPIFEVSDQAFRTLTSVKTSSGLLAVSSIPTVDVDPLLNKASKLVYLHEISNPSNLGAVCRNAAAFEFDAVLLSENSTDPFHPESVRSSAGAVFSVPIFTISFEKLLGACKKFNWVVLDVNAEETVSSAQFFQKSIFVFGSEEGFFPDSSLMDKVPVKRVRLEHAEAVDSLNLSVSSGILFYTLYTQNNRL